MNINCPKAIITVMLAASVMSGCDKICFPYGDKISFGTKSVTVPYLSMQTKSAYSGEIDDSEVERIDWEVGDKLQIWCSEASAPTGKNAAYVVSKVNGASGAKSGADVDLSKEDSPEGLCWGEDVTHNFYAVSPSPVSEGVTKSMNGKTVTGSIPKSQSYKSVSVNGNHTTIAPLLEKSMMMVAQKSITETDFSDEDVFLDFTPLTTAFEFTITNSTGYDLKLKSVRLSSGDVVGTTGHPLSGPFSLTIGEKGSDIYSGYEACTYTGTLSEDKSVSIGPFPENGDGSILIAKDGVLTFTLFVNPADELDDLIFHFDVWNEKSRFTKLQKSNGEKITFKKHYKTFLKGLFLPQGVVWQVRYEPGVYPWDKILGGMDLNDPSADLENLVRQWDGGEVGTVSLDGPAIAWESLVTKWESGETGPVDLVEVGSESYTFKLTDESQGIQTFVNTTEDSSTETIEIASDLLDAYPVDWTIKSYKIGTAKAVDVNGTSFTAGGLTVSKDGSNLNVTALARTPDDKGSHGYWTNAGGVSGDSEGTSWSPKSWVSKGIIDLSTLDFQTDTPDAHAMTTANCYVIRHAGTYKLPLVYGNAVKGGAENQESYYPNVTGGDNRLVRFVNSAGNGIQSPFIENADGCGGSDLKCAVVWQDKAEVVGNLEIVGGETSPYTMGNVRYLQFTISQADICQNNALICIYKDKEGGTADQYDPGEAIWSWHIWTTNDPALLSAPISVTNLTNVEYKFFPINNLGWLEPDYSRRDQVVITLEQLESGETIDVIVKQPVVLGNSNGCWYQFGRKDPLCTTDTPYKGTLTFNNIGSTLANAISDPGTFYSPGSTEDSNDWCTTPYNNLWTGKFCTTENGRTIEYLVTSVGALPVYSSEISLVNQDNTTMIKTVYDPSPVGYKMPAPKAFTGFTTGNASLAEGHMDELNAEGGFNYGWHFYARPGRNGNTIFFPSSGARLSYWIPGVHDHVGAISPADASFGGYWSAIPYEKNAYGLIFNQYLFCYKMLDYYSDRAFGASARPVLE